MRTFGFALIVIGLFVIYLGWNGKLWPAVQALLTGKVPKGVQANNGPTVTVLTPSGPAKTTLTVNPSTGPYSTGSGRLINPNGTTSLPNFSQPDPNTPGGISITPGL